MSAISGTPNVASQPRSIPKEEFRLAQSGPAAEPADGKVDANLFDVIDGRPDDVMSRLIQIPFDFLADGINQMLGLPEISDVSRRSPMVVATLRQAGIEVDPEGEIQIPDTPLGARILVQTIMLAGSMGDLTGSGMHAIAGFDRQILRDLGVSPEFFAEFERYADEMALTGFVASAASLAGLAAQAASVPNAQIPAGNPQLNSGRVDLSNYSGGPTIDVTPGSGGAGGGIVHKPGGPLVGPTPSTSGLTTTSTTAGLAVTGGANNNSAITSRDQGATVGGAITNPSANTSTGLNRNSTITSGSAGETPSLPREGVEYEPEAPVDLPEVNYGKLGEKLERVLERYDEVNDNVSWSPMITREVANQMMERQQQRDLEQQRDLQRRQVLADRERASFADPETHRFPGLPEGFGPTDATGGDIEKFGVPNRDGSDKLLFDIPFGGLGGSGGTGGSSGSGGAGADFGPGLETNSVSGGAMVPLSQMDLTNGQTLAAIEAASAQDINAWLDPMSEEERLALPEAVHKAILANFDRQVADLSSLVPPSGSSDPAAALANSPEMERLSKELLLGLRLDEAALEGGHILEGHGPFNVFLSDSGSGSFVAYPPIKRVLDALGINANLLVTGDHASGAYGAKPQDEIVRLVFAWGELAGKISAADQQKIGDVLAMACNTACIADFYRKEAGIDFPSDGIPVLNLIDNTSGLVADPANRDVFGTDPVILSTQATVNSGQYPRLISDYSNGEVTAHNIGGSDAPITLPDGSRQLLDLATLVNQQAHLDPARADEIERVVSHYVDKFPADMTSLVMCCTHYPALAKAFERELASRGMYPVIVDPMTNQGVKIVEALSASVEGTEPPVIPGPRRPDLVITSANGTDPAVLDQAMGSSSYTGRDLPTFWGAEFGKDFPGTPVADFINGLAGEDPDPSYFDLRPDELKEQRPD